MKKTENFQYSHLASFHFDKNIKHIAHDLNHNQILIATGQMISILQIIKKKG